jgi:single-strand DNA-binding protein
MNGITAAFQGRLPRDADALRYTSQGTALLSFSVAVEDSRRGEGDPTEWVRVTAWGELAEDLVDRLPKGAEVYVEGRLRCEQWTGSDGQPRAGLAVSAWKVEPLGQIGRRAKAKGATRRAVRQAG